MDVSGSCLCGKVTINLTGVAKEITVCHCSLCQKFHGGPMFALAPCSEDQMALQGVKWLRRYDSSEWAQRGFCSQCGSSLFFYLNGKNAVGLLYRFLRLRQLLACCQTTQPQKNRCVFH